MTASEKAEELLSQYEDTLSRKGHSDSPSWLELAIERGLLIQVLTAGLQATERKT